LRIFPQYAEHLYEEGIACHQRPVEGIKVNRFTQLDAADGGFNFAVKGDHKLDEHGLTPAIT